MKNKLLQLEMNTIINYVIVLYALSIPISRAGISGLSILMVLLWFFSGNIKEKLVTTLKISVVSVIVVFLSFSLLSLLWTQANYVSDGFDKIEKFIRLILLPIIVIVTTLKKEYIPKIFAAFLLGMFISEVISYGIFFEWWIFKDKTPSDPTPFMHHLDYSTFLAFTSLLLLNKFFHSDESKLKVFYFLYFLFVTSNLFINGGRTGQLAFVVSIFVLGIVNAKNKFKMITGIFILVGAILTTAYSFSPVFQERVNSATHEIAKIYHNDKGAYEGSFGTRLGLWVLGIEILQEDPFLGVGAGSVPSTLDTYIGQQEELFGHIKVRDMHNTYMENLITYGIIGFFIYMLIWFSLMKTQIEDKFISSLRVVFISVFLMATLFENLFFNQFPMSLFGLMVGIFIFYSQQKTRSLSNG
jgi:O-antigen ligase